MNNIRKLSGRHGNSAKITASLDIIADIIKAATGTVDYRDNSLTFPSYYGTPTRIDVSSVHATTVDGREVSDVVLIRTELPKEWSSLIDERQIAAANTMAALGALIREQGSGRLIVASRLSIFRGDEDVWGLYLPLVAFGALLQADALLLAYAKTMGLGPVSRRLEVPERENPNHWVGRDFIFAAERLNDIGVFSTAGEKGLTGEIPLSAGGVSAMLGHETSLLTFQTDMPHPALGNGLFYKLELPIHLDEDELVTFANKLNQIEIESVDSPPFIGAWCRKFNPSGIAYVGFWPNFLYQPGTVLNLAVWMLHRNRQAVTFISDSRREQ
jgi:hypothetical protein